MAKRNKKETFEIKKEREVVEVDKLKPHSKNPKLHDVQLIAKSIESLGFVDDVVIDENNVILGGHGRIKALKELGQEDVEVIRISNWTEKQKEKYLLAANQTTIAGGFNKDRFDLFDREVLDFSGIEMKLEEENPYTKKVVTPVYEPSEEKAHSYQLYDGEKTKKLLRKIDQLDIEDEQLVEFLRYAAHRFVEFDFEKIADYYAQTEDEEVKMIMEDLALVIIDYDKAIEKGYVTLFKKMMDNLEDEGYEK